MTKIKFLDKLFNYRGVYKQDVCVCVKRVSHVNFIPPLPQFPHDTHDMIFIQQIKKLKVVKTSFMSEKTFNEGTLIRRRQAI